VKLEAQEVVWVDLVEEAGSAEKLAVERVKAVTRAVHSVERVMAAVEMMARRRLPGRLAAGTHDTRTDLPVAQTHQVEQREAYP